MHRHPVVNLLRPWRRGHAALALTALCLPFHAPRSAQAAPVTVTYLGQQTVSVIQPLIDRFNNTHPGIHVKYQRAFPNWGERV